MGNHECTGFTDSNCPKGTETPNVRAFMGLMPADVTAPYYRVDVSTPSGSAKLLFVAPNGWSEAQNSWLTAQLADVTTYTFVVRHEPSDDATAPGVTPSDALINSAPLTIELLGHSHEYRRIDAQHVISGNGGAPLSSYSGIGYGFLLIAQQSDGTLVLSEIDQASGSTVDSFHITPDGKLVQ